ncbi:MAG: SoxW [uncultured Aureispira sp.]|uniref:SoxW n=1 Tax=uncultured Aureispira sp. TaxID=1331704 RepID=A0A6S6U3J9_9BACT|nr:MAG: SoxW [uncultured Aureispira sp.]
MKKILLGILTFSFFMAAYAFTAVPDVADKHVDGKNVKWMTWEEAAAASKAAEAAGETPKKIFVDIYTDWCGWCKKMDTETFEKSKISAYLNEHFYPVKFDAEQKESITFEGKTFKFVANGRRGYHELAAALLAGKMSYPTVVFLNKDFQLLQRIPGYLDIPTFDMIMHYLAEEHYTKTPWADFQKAYKSPQKMVAPTTNNTKN